MGRAVIVDGELGVVREDPPTTRVSILGFGASVEFWEYRKGDAVWSPNYRGPEKAVPHLTRSFQIHPFEVLDSKEQAWWEECPVPLYVPPGEIQRPHHVAYPLDLIVRQFGGYNQLFPLTSSFDYMTALALAEGFTEITYAGVELQRGTLRERLCEHVSLAFWIGRAEGSGVKITRIGRNLLNHPFYYGIEYWKEAQWSIEECQLAVLQNLRLHDQGANTETLRRLGRMAAHQDDGE